jgi:hypothetical protein
MVGYELLIRLGQVLMGLVLVGSVAAGFGWLIRQMTRGDE